MEPARQLALGLDVDPALARLGIPEVPFRPSDVATSRATLRTLLRRGHLRRLVRGVLVASAVPDTLSTRARGLALVVPAGAVVTDRTAAWLHGVDVLLPGEHEQVPTPSVFHLGRGRQLKHAAVRTGQRMMPRGDVMVIDGVPVTTPLRTALDLARLSHRDQALGILDAFVRAGVDHEELLDQIPRFKGYRGVIQLRQLAPLVDPGAESIPESITRLRWLECGDAPPPETQVPVVGPSGVTWYLDVASRRLMMAVEYDGERYHSTPEQVIHDRERRAWIAEHTPWVVHVVTKENLFGHRRDIDALLSGWVRDARASLGDRLTRGDWTSYDLGGESPWLPD